MVKGTSLTYEFRVRYSQINQWFCFIRIPSGVINMLSKPIGLAEKMEFFVVGIGFIFIVHAAYSIIIFRIVNLFYKLQATIPRASAF